MATIYVRTSGNDTTGTGLTGAPYASLSKAYSVAAAGDTILMGTGTYVEDTASGGYLLLTAAFASLVIITTETGLQDVVIKGAGTTYVMWTASIVNVWFDNLIFEAQANTVSTVHRITGKSIANVYWTRCVWRVRSSSSVNNIAIGSNWTTNDVTAHDLTWDTCRVEQIGHYATGGFLMDGQLSNSTRLIIRRTKFETSYYSCILYGTTDFIFEENECNAWTPLTGATAVHFGKDAATGQPVSGIAARNSIRAHTGHAIVVGGGADGVHLVKNDIFGGNNSGAGQGLVFKNAINSSAKGGFVYGGALSTLYLKACNNCTFEDMDLVSRFSTSSCIRVNQNDENGSKAYNNTIRRMRMLVQAGKAFDWGTSTDDDGGNISDDHSIALLGSATYGNVRGATITTVASLRSAWSGYNRPGNDRNTRLGIDAMRNYGPRIMELT